MLLVLGAVTLSACGGGSPANRETGPGTVDREPEMTITPPEAPPQAVGTIPMQTLTAGGTPTEVEVTRYFQDPDNDPLTYSAESSDPGILSVRMSGATLTLSPVSAGEATITITASDGGREATQAIAATVQEPEPPAEQQIENSPTRPPAPRPQPTPEPRQPPQPTPQPTPPQPREPETTLTDIDIVMTLSDNGRHADLRITFVPEDAQLTVLDYAVDPWGSFSRSRQVGNTRFIRFSCPNRNRYQGIVTITLSMQRTDVATSVHVDCQ